MSAHRPYLFIISPHLHPHLHTPPSGCRSSSPFLTFFYTTRPLTTARRPARPIPSRHTATAAVVPSIIHILRPLLFSLCLPRSISTASNTRIYMRPCFHLFPTVSSGRRVHPIPIPILTCIHTSHPCPHSLPSPLTSLRSLTLCMRVSRRPHLCSYIFISFFIFLFLSFFLSFFVCACTYNAAAGELVKVQHSYIFHRPRTGCPCRWPV